MFIEEAIRQAQKRIYNNIDVMCADARMWVAKDAERARAHIYGEVSFYIRSGAQQMRWHRYHHFVR